MPVYMLCTSCGVSINRDRHSLAPPGATSLSHLCFLYHTCEVCRAKQIRVVHSVLSGFPCTCGWSVYGAWQLSITGCSLVCVWRLHVQEWLTSLVEKSKAAGAKGARSKGPKGGKWTKEEVITIRQVSHGAFAQKWLFLGGGFVPRGPRGWDAGKHPPHLFFRSCSSFMCTVPKINTFSLGGV